jgi:hypothetical protein
VKRARNHEVQKDNRSHGQVKNQAAVPKKDGLLPLLPKGWGSVAEEFGNGQAQRLSTWCSTAAVISGGSSPKKAGDVVAQPRASGPSSSCWRCAGASSGNITGICLREAVGGRTRRVGQIQFPGGTSRVRPQQLKGKCTKHY